MLAKDSVKARLAGDAGISYTEFSYMLLQAYDFLHLHEAYDFELQIGGSDQWGNITAGIDLIRKTTGSSRPRTHVAAAARAATAPSSARPRAARCGSIPSARRRTSSASSGSRRPTTRSADYLLRFSTRPLDEVRATIAEHEQAPERRTGQRALAHELTELVHGAEAAQAADEAADVLFGGDPDRRASEAALAAVAREVPSSTGVASGDLDDLVELLVSVGSRRRPRATSGACSTAPATAATASRSTPTSKLGEQPLLHGRYLLLQRGRKSHHLVEVFS